MIRDLLNPSSGFLDLREDSKGVIQVAGITEVSTINAQEVGQPPDVLVWFSRADWSTPGGGASSMWWFFFWFLLDHGVTDEGQQAAHSGADGSQSDIIPLARRAAGGRQAAEPLPRRAAGGPLRTPLHDRPGRLWTGSAGEPLLLWAVVQVYISDFLRRTLKGSKLKLWTNTNKQEKETP